MTGPLRQLTPAERLDGLVAHGVELYLNDGGELRVRCEPSHVHILRAAKPSIRLHRDALVECLLDRRRKGRAQ
jgi:hypothetical protein